MSDKQKPSWWIFYSLWLTMTVLLTWDYSASRPGWLQKGLAVLIVLVFYGLIVWWMRMNRAAFGREGHANPSKSKPPTPTRTIPLTPVQLTYIKAMESHKPSG